MPAAATEGKHVRNTAAIKVHQTGDDGTIS